MYKLNMNNKYNCIGVDLINISTEIEDLIAYQLYPHIISCEGIPNYYIVGNKSLENSYYNEGNKLYINYNDSQYLLKTIRRSLRDIIYDGLIQDNYIKLHASAVSKNDDVFLFIGDRRAGKTSTALGLCKFCNYSLISGDLVLSKNDSVISWATPIGMRGTTSQILGIPGEIDLSNKTMNWYWPNEMLDMGYNYELSGKIKNIILPSYNFDIKSSKIRQLDYDEKLKVIQSNVHYEEINKNNFWNKKPINIERCKELIEKDSNIENYNMISYESNGLSEQNILTLEREIRRR